MNGGPILVVEDNPSMLQNICELLQMEGYEVVGVQTAQEALTALRAAPPQSIVCDVMLPDRDGFSLLGDIRREPGLADVPFLFLTARTHREDFRRGMELGADDFITKPFHASDLLNALRSRMERRAEFQNGSLAKLQDAHRRFSRILEHLPDLVYQLDDEGRFVYVNHAVQRLGYAPEELVGLHFSILLHPDDAEACSRRQILPALAGSATGPADAPLLFDEQRTGERITQGLEVRLIPRSVAMRPGEPPPADLPVGEVSAMGWEMERPDGTRRGTLGTIRDVSERKQLEELRKERQMLSAYFADDIVREMSRSESAMIGESLTATVLFLDIRNFTRISESMEPCQVAALLNRIYNDLMDLIISHHGSINKFAGDAILATFGCPVGFGDDAVHAVESALDIRRTMDFINRTRPDFLREEIRIGIGIATGRVFAGNIGSFRRKEYTVIGDVVNTASRLQQLTKRVPGGADILIDGATLAALPAADYRLRRLQVQSLRGKERPTEIHALMDRTRETISNVTLFRRRRDRRPG